MKLSDEVSELARLVMITNEPMSSEDADVLLRAAAILRSVESAQVGTVELDLGCVLRVRAERGQWFPPIDGQRVALVPLPQQSES